VNLPFGKLDELVENPSLLPVVATVAASVRPVPVVAAALVTVPVVTASLVTAPLQHRELTAEHTHPLRMAVVVRFTNRFANLTLEPRVESTVDLPLCMPVTVGRGLFPTFRDPDDLLEVLSLIKVRTTRIVRRPGRLVDRPPRIVDRPRRLHTRTNRPDYSWTTPGRNHDRRLPIPNPPILRIRLSHSRQRHRKKPKMK
jgi:hypothetical protein